MGKSTMTMNEDVLKLKVVMSNVMFVFRGVTTHFMLLPRVNLQSFGKSQVTLVPSRGSRMVPFPMHHRCFFEGILVVSHRQSISVNNNFEKE